MAFSDVFDRFRNGATSYVAAASGTWAMATQAVTVNGGAITLDYALGQQVIVSLTEDVTSVQVVNLPLNGAVMELLLTQDATGGHVVNWPAGWLSAGGFRPILPPTPGSISRVIIATGSGRTFLDFAGLDYK